LKFSDQRKAEQRHGCAKDNPAKLAEINADPATVGDHAQDLGEQALTNDSAKDVDIAMPREPWLSYDVWLVNSDAGK
jgi:hypothetical protein